jgi:hypothetical protein
MMAVVLVSKVDTGNWQATIKNYPNQSEFEF